MRSSAVDSSRSFEIACLALLPWVALAAPLGACAGGNGEGEVTGVVEVPTCSFTNDAFDLQPDFFVQGNWENTAEIRVQRGSDFDDISNGISVSIYDVDAVRASLGTPIDLATEGSPVSMSFRLGDTCWDGRRNPSIFLRGVAGTITFTALYEDGSGDGPETSASFVGVYFEDGLDPLGTATLSGYFSFLFARGRPGQRFP